MSISRKPRLLPTAALLVVAALAPASARAQAVDLACTTAPWPERAADPINVDGFALHPPAFQRLTNVELFLRTADGDDLLDAGITSADGAFQLRATTDLEPTEAVLEGRASGFWTSYHHFDGPLFESQGIALLMFDGVSLSVIDGLTEARQDENLGLLHVSFRDCGGSVIPGVVFEIETASDTARTLYLGNSSNPLTLFNADNDATSERGDALVFNLAPGFVTVTALIEDKPVASRRVEVRAGTTTGLTLTPRAFEVRAAGGPCSYPSQCGREYGCAQSGSGSREAAVWVLVLVTLGARRRQSGKTAI